MRRFVCGALIGIGLTGCSILPISPTQQQEGPVKPQLHLDVPFYSDMTDQCGPSALASVLTFWGPLVLPLDLKDEIYLAQLKGSLPMDLMLAAQHRGFKAELYSGSLEDLKSQLKQGHPLVAFINRGFVVFPIGHYVVINGYDEARQGLIIHSGSEKNRFVRYASFLKNWNKTQRSTLLIRPPDVGNQVSREKQ